MYQNQSLLNMKPITRFATIILSLGLGFFFSSCQKENVTDSSQQSAKTDSERRLIRTFYGPTIPFEGGIARAWVSEDLNGTPMAVGVNFSERALKNLPTVPKDYILNLPNHSATDFFKHVFINWNPLGHEPDPIYGLPHFDIHFYNITSADRILIGPNDSIQFANAPDTQYVPPFYVQTPGGVPMMGAHWIDVLSPEFNGSLFTKTFILGSYDGEFIFWEPMITLDYFLTRPDVTIPIRQPQAFHQDGWYPQNYLIRFTTSPNQYTVALTDLMYHQGQ